VGIARVPPHSRGLRPVGNDLSARIFQRRRNAGSFGFRVRPFWQRLEPIGTLLFLFDALNSAD